FVDPRLNEVESVSIFLCVDQQDAPNLERARVDVEENLLVGRGRVFGRAEQDVATRKLQLRRIELRERERLLQAALTHEKCQRRWVLGFVYLLQVHLPIL